LHRARPCLKALHTTESFSGRDGNRRLTDFAAQAPRFVPAGSGYMSEGSHSEMPGMNVTIRMTVISQMMKGIAARTAWVKGTPPS